ncbi:unnamed protein product [Dovyalis caffra]|uniref:Receptor-like serine/threonine-protein kinase n=1 Tax=Dovyalis caffra TaxID=77055 RepID=A0AAV1RRB0_9ROSI|nr:unnamed protein product [Dovyalis caffra]
MDFSLPHCFCFFLLLLPISTSGQTYRNISLGSYLTAAKDKSSWTSPSGDFAFGFQQVGDAGFLLAIWFNKIPERTIVWSANRNDLVRRGSRVQVTTDGQLVLSDQSGRRIRIADSVENGVAYAAMLDTGNFVLASQSAANLWQSFDQPTDTMLPTQNLSLGGELIAPYLERNYSDGRYKFILSTEGNLQMYTTRYPSTANNVAYWSTPSPTVGGYQVIYNQSGYMYLVAKNGTVLNFVFSSSVSMQDFYQRATLDYDGVFRQYVYPKAAASRRRRWNMAWTSLSPSIPSNICLSTRGAVGGGACGYNSYCSLGGDQRPSCQCPSGYTFLDPNDVRKGCKQNFVSQDCDQPSEETDNFDFMDMPNADWPDNDYEHFDSVDEDWCRQACLSDCYCAVATFKDRNCWKKRIPFSNGRIDPSYGTKALIKVRIGNSTTGPSSKKNDRSTLIITGSALLGSSVFLNVLSLIGIYVFISRLSRQKQKMIQPLNVMPGVNPVSFTYNELETATGGFKEELGSGAFGTVYKGDLANEDTPLIAVKKLEKMVEQGEQEFETEVKVIGRTNHKNLVQLLGFCNEGQHRLLVYEYMSNGSLSIYLFGDSRPNWYRRVQIACDVARGLLYLHEECSSQIIHCDIKPQNILLDESLNARISDFGLAKLLKRDQTKTTTAIRGTKGYVAPEWFKNLPVTTKVDIYSFGILLLELVCCRKKFELDVMEEDQIVLADWAYDCFKEAKLDLLVEADEEAMEDMKRVERFVMVAIWCIQEDPSLRPGMKKVVQILEGAVQVSIPPEPTSFISSI